MNRRTRLWLNFLAMSILAACFPAYASAHHSGTWKWTSTTESGQTFESSAKLRRDGRSFAGVYIGQEGQETKITSPKLDGSQLSFQVTRVRDGKEFTVRYQGKIAGDTIRGKQEFRVGEQARALPWVAKRVREINVTGTWKWSRTRQNGQKSESTLRLKQLGTDVTGLYVGRRGDETPITDGKLQRDQLSFQVTLERNGQQFTIDYQGKIAGDSIQGEFEVHIDDQARTRPWEAKRFREPANAAGMWTWSRTTQNGQTFESALRLKQDGAKITGVYIGRSGNEIAISESKLHGNDLSFQVTRKRDGQDITSKYRGKIMGNMIHGARESSSGTQGARPWRAERATAPK